MLLTIETVKRIGKQLNSRGVVLIVFDYDGRFGVASYGATKEDCKKLADYVDLLTMEIDSGLSGPNFNSDKSQK